VCKDERRIVTLHRKVRTNASVHETASAHYGGQCLRHVAKSGWTPVGRPPKRHRPPHLFNVSGYIDKYCASLPFNPYGSRSVETQHQKSSAASPR